MRARTYATAADRPVTTKNLGVSADYATLKKTYPRGIIHISFNFAGVRLYATLLNSSAGVNSDTLMTLSLRCVALSVTPVRERM
jgi:hypothetical protein